MCPGRWRISSGKKGGGRKLTPEEKALWELVTRHADPLRQALEDEEPQEIPIRKPTARSYKSRQAVPIVKDSKMPELAPGSYAGVDGSTAEKFRRGDYPIDATLDLHGMSRQKAHRALEDFLLRQYGRGARCLLVITGKGTGKGTGVLRESLPGWLTHPDLRPMVLAVDGARPKHGGGGAYYILLKRKR